MTPQLVRETLRNMVLVVLAAALLFFLALAVGATPGPVEFYGLVVLTAIGLGVVAYRARRQARRP